MIDFSQRYNYIRTRQLEGTYPGDSKEGVWGINHKRTQFGWGKVEEHRWPYFKKGADDFLDPEPPGLDQAAKRYRIRRYQRVRNSGEARKILRDNEIVIKRRQRGASPSEAGVYLEVSASFEITREFEQAPKGLVSLPPPDSPVIGAHAVPLGPYSESQRRFEFVNSWGEGWGDKGRGSMPFEFFDRFMTEVWATDSRPASLPEVPGIRELSWKPPDPLGDQFYGFEIYDGDADERMGWAFAVHRDGRLDVEELYMRPMFRGRRYGARLAEMLLELSTNQGLSLRAWISFADSDEGNRPALAATVRKLGLTLRRSGVRWAAYRAVPGRKRDVIFEPVRIPPRAAHVKGSGGATPPVAANIAEEEESWAALARKARVSRLAEELD